MKIALSLRTLLLAAVLVPALGALTHTALAQTPPTFRGSTPGVQGPVSLHAGLVIVRGRSNGTANFTASLVAQDPGATVQNSFDNRYLMIDAVGAYNGAAATLLRQDGDYFLEIGQASGPYQLTVEQPSPETVQPVNKTSFSGRGQQVTSPFTLPPGTYTVTATNDSSALRVRMYSIDDLGGAAVLSPDTGYYGDELMDTTIPPSLTSVSITVDPAGYRDDGTPINGTFLFYVDAEGTGPGNWTVTVQ